jgi:hypothetical protein
MFAMPEAAPLGAASSILNSGYLYGRKNPLARQKSKPLKTGYALCDVVSSRSSNQRVPRSPLGGLNGDEPARRAIEEQDNAIAGRAGRPRVSIKIVQRPT